MSLEIKLKPVYVEATEERLGRARARKFQKELADTSKDFVLLSAPTGSGKTVALLTDRENHLAIGLYPNNELICSQAAGLDRFIVEYLGMRREYEYLSEMCWKAAAGAEDTELYPLNYYRAEGGVDVFGERVSEIYVVGLSGRLVVRPEDDTKLKTIRDLLQKLPLGYKERESRGAYVIVLGTPDTFFLLSTYSYRSFERVGRAIDILSRASKRDPEYFENFFRTAGISLREELSEISSVVMPFALGSTVFVDEFHLYGPLEVSSLRLLLFALKEVWGFKGRVLLSTATPQPEVLSALEEEWGSGPHRVDAAVKTHGEADELVRGATTIKMVSVGGCGGNVLGRRYKCSELSYELLEELDASEGRRMMFIVEKVGHAERTAKALFERWKVKPACFYSLRNEEVCAELSRSAVDEARFIVGTGASIGQGVEFRGVDRGVIARVTLSDYLQSVSRVCRGIEGECTVYTPICEEEAGKIRRTGELDYQSFVEWLRESRIFYAARRDSSRLIADYLGLREAILKRYIVSTFYRETGSRVIEVPELPRTRRSIVATPEELAHLVLFRRGGIQVKVRRGEKTVEADLGVVVRNFDFEVEESGVLRLGDILTQGSSTVEYKCERNLLEALESGSLVGKSFLERVLRCKLEAGGAEVRYEGGEILLYVNISDSDFADFLSRTGRGFRIASTPQAVLVPL